MCNNFLVSIQKSVIFLSDNINVILHILRQGKFLYWDAFQFFKDILPYQRMGMF